MPMNTPYELLFVNILPAARAAIAKKLVNNYGLSQKEAGDRLGVTQPAISQYKRNLRGRRNTFSDSPVISQNIDSLARRLASGEIGTSEATNELFEMFKVYLNPE